MAAPTSAHEELYHISLFTGGGGELLASQWLKGWRTVCYVEWDEYAVRKVIKPRIRDGYLHDAPIWNDVRSFTKRNNQARRFIRSLRKIRHNLIITGGFPCQPFSVAGKQNSSLDERNGWPDTIRILREIRPRYAFFENVRGLLSAVDTAADEPDYYFGTILRDISESGYDAKWGVLSALDVGALHRRERLWITCENREFIPPSVPYTNGRSRSTVEEFQHNGTKELNGRN